MRNTQTCCDFCNAILYGNDRKSFQVRPFIQLRGSLVLQNQPDESTGYHVYITQRGQEELIVCNIECLQNYIELKHAQYKNHRLNQLKEEATAEFVAGGKSYKKY